MTIVKTDQINGLRTIESQSNRRTCWVDGYIAVPPHLETAVWESGGYCDLDIVDGVLVDITPTERPPEPEPEPIIDPQDDTDALLIDHELRLTLLELGGI